MSNARNLANIIAGTYDIPASALDNAVQRCRLAQGE